MIPNQHHQNWYYTSPETIEIKSNCWIFITFAKSKLIPRNQTYGGIMHAIVNAFPIAKYLNKKIKVVDVRINNKKKSPLFIKHVANISSYKNLGYGNEKLYFNGFDILFKKIDFLIKALINKYLIFSLLVKLIFVLKYFNLIVFSYFY